MATGGGRLKNVVSDTEFQKELIAAGEKVVVVDFFAHGYEPCKKVAPVFERLSEKYTNAVFIMLDVEICRNTPMRYDVKTMPTFLFFKNREKIFTLKGTSEEALEKAVEQHVGSSSAAEEGTKVNAASVPGQMNLISLIDRSGSECLNESDDHPFSHCLKTDETYLESDCDEQLIMVLAFQQPVKLHTLQFVGPSDGRAPKTVKLFINQPQTLDFDAAEQRKPIQELALTENDVREDATISLSFVKFQNVQSLTVFVKNNQGGRDTTVLQFLGLFGTPLDATNMKDFKRVTGEKGERHA